MNDEATGGGDGHPPVGTCGRARETLTAEERRERNKDYQARHNARKRGEIVPVRWSSHSPRLGRPPDEVRPKDPAPSLMTPAEREEHQHYLDAVRQHLDDVAAGDIPPAKMGAGSTQRRTPPAAGRLIAP